MVLEAEMAVDYVADPKPGHWRFWGTVAWGLVLLAISTFIQGTTLAVIVLSRAKFPNMLDPAASSRFFATNFAGALNGATLAWAIIVSDLACVGAIAFIIFLKNGESIRDYLSVHSVRVVTVLKWLGITALFVILSGLLTRFLHIGPGGREVQRILYSGTGMLWFVWVAVVLVAPLFEEVFFRGFLFRGFETSFLKTAGAIIVTSILWAALHVQYNFYGIVYVACLGVLFGLARAATRSLLVPLTLHVAVNFAAVASHMAANG